MPHEDVFEALFDAPIVAQSALYSTPICAVMHHTRPIAEKGPNLHQEILKRDTKGVKGTEHI
jgi:hypothetical protein